MGRLRDMLCANCNAEVEEKNYIRRVQSARDSAGELVDRTADW
jgi:hypothetical protein